MRSIATLLVLFGIGAAIWIGKVYAEREFPQHLPWTPLRIEQPVGSATKLKLEGLAGDKPACLALFAGTDYAVDPAEDRSTAPDCGFVDAVTLQRMSAAYDPGTVELSCPLAAALAIWEENVVQPAARRTLGSPVATVEHFGTYSCRRMYGAAEGRWSHHATAQAIDIAGFRLADGRRISLRRDWGGDSDAGAFLMEIRDGGCGIFGTLLGPDYNAAHADHFHLQAQGFGTCR